MFVTYHRLEFAVMDERRRVNYWNNPVCQTNYLTTIKLKILTTSTRTILGSRASNAHALSPVERVLNNTDLEPKKFLRYK